MAKKIKDLYHRFESGNKGTLTLDNIRRHRLAKKNSMAGWLDRNSKILSIQDIEIQIDRWNNIVKVLHPYGSETFRTGQCYMEILRDWKNLKIDIYSNMSKASTWDSTTDTLITFDDEGIPKHHTVYQSDDGKIIYTQDNETKQVSQVSIIGGYSSSSARSVEARNVDTEFSYEEFFKSGNAITPRKVA